ncbi:MAG: MerR family transcriptional regulator [Pseudomonadota bacterium]|nr:MerR family transcriptional regulator [Pseudomonadota bacterium]
MIEGTVADNDYPMYSIGVVADLLQVHPRTLRLYEKAGLLFPSRRGGKRFYSRNDVSWLQCLRRLIHEEGVNISGLQKLLQLAPCWEIRQQTCREHHCCRHCALKGNSSYYQIQRRCRQRGNEKLEESKDE